MEPVQESGGDGADWVLGEAGRLGNLGIAKLIVRYRCNDRCDTMAVVVISIIVSWSRYWVHGNAAGWTGNIYTAVWTGKHLMHGDIYTYIYNPLFFKCE